MGSKQEKQPNILKSRESEAKLDPLGLTSLGFRKIRGPLIAEVGMKTSSEKDWQGQ
jgi:hypothetical protein